VPKAKKDNKTGRAQFIVPLQNHKNCRGVFHTPKENQQRQYGSNKFDHYTKNYTLFEKALNFEL